MIQFTKFKFSMCLTFFALFSFQCFGANKCNYIEDVDLAPVAAKYSKVTSGQGVLGFHVWIDKAPSKNSIRILEDVTDNLDHLDIGSLTQHFGDIWLQAKDKTVSSLLGTELFALGVDAGEAAINKKARAVAVKRLLAGIDMSADKFGPDRLADSLTTLSKLENVENYKRADAFIKLLPTGNGVNITDFHKFLGNNSSVLKNPSDFDDVIRALDALRDADGKLPGGIINQAGDGGSRLLLTLGNRGKGSRGFFYEPVAIVNLMNDKKFIARFGRKNLKGMGNKIKTGNGGRQIEADALYSVVGVKDFGIDFKHGIGKPDLEDLENAFDAIKNKKLSGFAYANSSGSFTQNLTGKSLTPPNKEITQSVDKWIVAFNKKLTKLGKNPIEIINSGNFTRP